MWRNTHLEYLHRQVAVVMALTGLAAILWLAPSIAQEGCGIAAGVFEVDGDFHSSEDGFIDWALGDMGLGVFDNDGNPVLDPALYVRDPHWAGNAVDPDHFEGEAKNNDNIDPDANPWEWGPGNGPQKNDLTDVYAFSMTRDGDVWLFLGALTRATNGSNHIDFEFNQQGFQQIGETEGIIFGNGPDAGRTAGVDFTASVDYFGGGDVPVASFRRWQAVGDGFEYIETEPKLGDVLICANEITVPAPPWGAIGPSGEETGEVIALQFVELALNLTSLGIDPSVFCTDFSTLLFKTRSSTSFESSLKDLSLHQFSIIPPPDCSITFDDDSICAGETAEFCGPDGIFEYEWTGPSGFISDQQCILIDVPGVYELVVTDEVGCTSDPCSHELVVTPLPPCDITFDVDTICEGDSAEFCGPEAPQGQTYSYEWSGPGGPYPDQRCIYVKEEGDYTLFVTDVGADCSSVDFCQQSLTVNARPPCDIDGPTLICTGFFAKLCGPKGDYSYSWDGPGGPFEDEGCIIARETGTYTLVVTNNLTGCVSDTCSHDLIVADNPICDIDGPGEICEGEEAILCGPDDGEELIYTWEGPGGPYESERCIAVSDSGVYLLTVENVFGCVATCSETLVVNDNTTAGELWDLALCTGEEAEFCIDASGTPPFSYVWKKDGEVIEGETEECLVIPSITEDDVGEYCVEVTGACGPTLERCAELELADVSITELDDLYLCPEMRAEFCVVPSGIGPFSYQWSKDGKDIAGATDSCYVIESVTEQDEGEYCVTVEGICGDPAVGCAVLLVGTCEKFCTLTQGYYGNSGGHYNGMTTLELLDMLIPEDDPLIIGKLGIRSVAFEHGSEHCIIERLPAGGPVKAFHQNHVDEVIDPEDCQILPPGPPLPLMDNRFRNILLGQTITLSLNTRLDPLLSGMPVCSLMIAIPADENGEPDPDGDPRIFTMPMSVLEALVDLGLPLNVGGLLELANQGLAREDIDGSNLSHINQAVSIINELFDECGFVIECTGGPVLAGGRKGGIQTDLLQSHSDQATSPAAFDLAVRSPAALSAHVKLAIPEQSRVSLSVYDVRGRKLVDLAEGIMVPGFYRFRLDTGSRGWVSSGIYFIRAQFEGLESGKRLRRTQKIAILH